jgi:alkyl sulfatase BDS1-like metallo-beta-lactamase superfamily hydrolase
MSELLALSSKIIDSGIVSEPVNRVTQQLSELADGGAIVESFSHVVTFRTDEGLVVFDASGVGSGERCVAAVRRWSAAPLHTLVYTHGHMDHVGGSAAFAADARARGGAQPRVVAHENVLSRFARYDRTNGYNLAINARQFGGVRGILGIGGRAERFRPPDTLSPTLVFRDAIRLDVGDLAFELRHARGETDDHVWAWIPRLRTLCVGDFFIWNFPNAGNPQKVQRYPDEWAVALREMAALGAELMIPAHGLPIAGADRIRTVLCNVAKALETLVEQTLKRMNAGWTLDAILHDVRVPDTVLKTPYLRPLYDEPEFVVRNVWRLYGGWYDGNPAHFQPAPQAAVARELAELAGGAASLAKRARERADEGDLRLACELVELAAQAAPDDRAIHAVRADRYERRRNAASSLMAKGIYAAAAHGSREPFNKATSTPEVDSH